MADEEDAFGVGHAQFAPKAFGVARQDVAVAIDFRADAPGFAVAAQAAAATRARSPCLQRAMGSARALACIGQRPADRTASGEDGFDEGVETDTRGACAPLSSAW